MKKWDWRLCQRKLILFPFNFFSWAALKKFYGSIAQIVLFMFREIFFHSQNNGDIPGCILPMSVYILLLNVCFRANKKAMFKKIKDNYDLCYGQ